jgi:hypothetical protein
LPFFCKVDEPTILVKGNAVGVEDTKIRIPIGVTLGETDGSESYVMLINSTSVPSGAILYGENGEPLEEAGGFFLLYPADVGALQIQPPEHWSSALQGDIKLETTFNVTDSSSGGLDEQSFDLVITVYVKGVSDKPNALDFTVDAVEDEPYKLGQYIGGLEGILVDTDGSEKLSLVLGGLPDGMIPVSNEPEGISYIGNGEWKIEEKSLESLTIVPLPNSSGKDLLSTLTFRAISQELDGDESYSELWTVTFDVLPIADGFSSWPMGPVIVTERENDVDGIGVSLASIGNYELADDDNSEEVVHYELDLSRLLEDAGIAVRLQELTGNPTAVLTNLLESIYWSGKYQSYDATTGIITVLPDKIKDLKLSSELFLHSNQDFSIPVKALIRDTATIGGVVKKDEKYESKTLTINLIGTPDIPTVFADSISGNSSNRIGPVYFGGETTDTDLLLGRNQSELIYYIVSADDIGNFPGYQFADVNGTVVGFNSGNDTWLFTAEDVKSADGGLFFSTGPYANGTAYFTFTSVAMENDGRAVATNATGFSVEITNDGTGLGEIYPPNVPLVNIGDNNGIEDVVLSLSNLTALSADEPAPILSFSFSNYPEDAVFDGGFLNTVTGAYVALAEDVAAGLVTIEPPEHFTGDMVITVEVTATNEYFLTSTTGEFNVTLYFDPVADGVSFEILPLGQPSLEDEPILLDIQLNLKVQSEVLGPYVYISVGEDFASLVASYPIEEDDEDLKGYYKVPTDDVLNGPMSLQPKLHYHGNVPIQVFAYSIEPTDDEDGDHLKLSASGTVNIYVSAVADKPFVTGPVGLVTGLEDPDEYPDEYPKGEIPIPGLSASLVNDMDGSEILSVVVSGAPEGSIYSHGTNTGGQRWSIPVNDLESLAIKPPEHFAGTMALTLTGISKELSNGSEAQAQVNFTVVVEPQADTFLMVAKDLVLGANDTFTLELNIRMEDNSIIGYAGELPAETITLSFMDIPTNVTLVAPLGGSVFEIGGGKWEFTGSENESNALQLVATAAVVTSTQNIKVTGFTTDNDSVLAIPVKDTFRLEVTSTPATRRRHLRGSSVRR